MSNYCQDIVLLPYGWLKKKSNLIIREYLMKTLEINENISEISRGKLKKILISHLIIALELLN